MRRFALAMSLLIAACGHRSPFQSTAIPGSTPMPTVSLFLVGDIADCVSSPTINGRKSFEYVADLLATQNLDGRNNLLLLLGDNVYFRGSIEEFRNCYDPAFGRFKRVTFPTPGNHEYETPGATGYYEYFQGAAVNPQGAEGLGYYSFEPQVEGNVWHIVSLNCCLDPSGMARQLAWLEQDLALHQNVSCTLAFTHYPFISSGVAGGQRETQAMANLLYRYGVELLVAGHDHNFEEFEPLNANLLPDLRGLRSFVAGTGGAALKPRLSHQGGSVLFDNQTFGVLRINLATLAYAYEFMPAVGTFTRMGQGTCH